MPCHGLHCKMKYLSHAPALLVSFPFCLFQFKYKKSHFGCSLLTRHEANSPWNHSHSRIRIVLNQLETSLYLIFCHTFRPSLVAATNEWTRTMEAIYARPRVIYRKRQSNKLWPDQLWNWSGSTGKIVQFCKNVKINFSSLLRSPEIENSKTGFFGFETVQIFGSLIKISLFLHCNEWVVIRIFFHNLRDSTKSGAGRSTWLVNRGFNYKAHKSKSITTIPIPKFSAPTLTWQFAQDLWNVTDRLATLINFHKQWKCGLTPRFIHSTQRNNSYRIRIHI
jgi:hypothetical protein